MVTKKKDKDKGEGDIEKQVLALKTAEMDGVQELVKQLAKLTTGIIERGEDLSPQAARELANKLSEVKYAEVESGERLPPNLQSVIDKAQELTKQSVRE